MKLDFERNFGPLDKKVLSALEQGWNIKFPKEYKEFLAKTNGGRPIKKLFSLKNNADRSLVAGLFGIIDEKNYNLLTYYPAMVVDTSIPANMFPIGDDQLGNFILLSIKGSDYGKVYFWDHNWGAEPADYSNLTSIADSFEEFINGLKSEDEIE